MSCSNGELKMGNVSATVVCEGSCLWLICDDKSSHPEKKKKKMGGRGAVLGNLMTDALKVERCFLILDLEKSAPESA